MTGCTDVEKQLTCHDCVQMLKNSWHAMRVSTVAEKQLTCCDSVYRCREVVDVLWQCVQMLRNSWHAMTVYRCYETVDMLWQCVQMLRNSWHAMTVNRCWETVDMLWQCVQMLRNSWYAVTVCTDAGKWVKCCGSVYRCWETVAMLIAMTVCTDVRQTVVGQTVNMLPKCVQMLGKQLQKLTPHPALGEPVGVRLSWGTNNLWV